MLALPLMYGSKYPEGGQLQFYASTLIEVALLTQEVHAEVFETEAQRSGRSSKIKNIKIVLYIRNVSVWLVIVERIYRYRNNVTNNTLDI